MEAYQLLVSTENKEISFGHHFSDEQFSYGIHLKIQTHFI